MLAVSAEFLQAIKNKAPQDVRLEFSNGDVIGTSDIAITSGGLNYTEILNGETDVIFGRAVMSELSAVLINAEGRFTDFDFSREFTAKIGVNTFNGPRVAHSGDNTVSWTSAADGYYYEYRYRSASSFTTIYRQSGASISNSTYISCPGIKILIVYGDYNVYAIGEDYSILKAWTRASGTNTHRVVDTPSEYPAGLTAEQIKEWTDAGTFVRMVDVVETEYINLGVFHGERPEKVRGKLIDFTAHDRMSLFDRSAASFADGLTFPCTLGEIYTRLCDFCGVGYASSVFTNSDKTFDTNPLENTDYTCRNILGWIAEAAGSYARMSRDGAVELVWFGTADYTVSRTDRFEMSESEFKTPPIDKLEVYNSYGDQLNTSGTGDVVYGISDNPFLYIENDTQLAGLQPYVDTIYNRITSLPAYQPSSFRAEFNPAVQCGDIISVVDDYDVTISFPVFVQTITWNGFGKTTYENTGGVIRQNAPFAQRELEQIKKKMLRNVDLKTYVDSYLNSEEGIAAINAAVEGNFVTEDQLTGFVTESELNTSIEQYINGTEGKAAIVQAVSGTFVTTEQLDGYVTTDELDGYVTEDQLDGYVTTTQLDARIEAYINGEEGKASITESLIGTFVTEDELGDFVTESEVSTSITQEINKFGATLKLTAGLTESSTTAGGQFGTYETVIPDSFEGQMFNFEKTSDGYYTSQNAGVNTSFSYGYWEFSNSSGSEKKIILRCISYGENNYDYGLISELNTELAFSYKADSSGVLYSFQGKSSPDPVEIPITIPTGSSFLTFKYIKDSSDNLNEDYFKFVALEVITTGGGNTSSITLTQNGIEQSSVDIVFNGFVTFNDLEQEGSTTINGANVTTENLHVENVFLGGDNSRKIITSNLGSSGGTVDIGFIEDYGSSGYGKVVKIYADFLYIIPPGGSETDEEVLVISPKNMYFGANSSDWTFDI